MSMTSLHWIYINNDKPVYFSNSLNIQIFAYNLKKERGPIPQITIEQEKAGNEFYKYVNASLGR